MKRLTMLAVVLFLAAGVAFASERGSVPTSEIPEVKEVIGGGAQTLEATYFPSVKLAGEFDEECAQRLEDFAGDYIPDTGDWRIKKIRTTGEKIKKKFISKKALPTDLVTTVDILPAHKKTAKILVFWTVRVVGQCLPWQITGDVCEYAQFAEFTCIDNNVKTYVSVTDAAKSDSSYKESQACTLQIPQMTNNSDETSLFDPTITGTYVITAADFGGIFPDKVKIQIYWQNEGSMRVTSLDKMRNLIVNVIPYSKANK
jgi:hypothetical protein